MKRKTRFDFYFKKKEISRMRDVINENNAIKYLIKNNFDLKIYDKYLNNINIKHNKLTKKDIKKSIIFSFFITIFISHIKHL